MLGFDGLLRRSNALRDETRLDGYVLFHAQAEHEILHALAAENSEQVVLQREIKTGASGIVLTSRTTAQLIIDAPGLVTFGSQDVQSAECDDLVVFSFDLTPD